MVCLVVASLQTGTIVKFTFKNIYLSPNLAGEPWQLMAELLFPVIKQFVLLFDQVQIFSIFQSWYLVDGIVRYNRRLAEVITGPGGAPFKTVFGKEKNSEVRALMS